MKTVSRKISVPIDRISSNIECKQKLLQIIQLFNECEKLPSVDIHQRQDEVINELKDYLTLAIDDTKLCARYWLYDTYFNRNMINRESSTSHKTSNISINPLDYARSLKRGHSSNLLRICYEHAENLSFEPDSEEFLSLFWYDQGRLKHTEIEQRSTAYSDYLSLRKSSLTQETSIAKLQRSRKIIVHICARNYRYMQKTEWLANYYSSATNHIRPLEENADKTAIFDVRLRKTDLDELQRIAIICGMSTAAKLIREAFSGLECADWLDKLKIDFCHCLTYQRSNRRRNYNGNTIPAAKNPFLLRRISDHLNSLTKSISEFRRRDDFHSVRDSLAPEVYSTFENIILERFRGLTHHRDERFKRIVGLPHPEPKPAEYYNIRRIMQKVAEGLASGNLPGRKYSKEYVSRVQNLIDDTYQLKSQLLWDRVYSFLTSTGSKNKSLLVSTFILDAEPDNHKLSIRYNLAHIKCANAGFNLQQGIVVDDDLAKIIREKGENGVIDGIEKLRSGVELPTVIEQVLGSCAVGHQRKHVYKYNRPRRI